MLLCTMLGQPTEYRYFLLLAMDCSKTLSMHLLVYFLNLHITAFLDIYISYL